MITVPFLTRTKTWVLVAVVAFVLVYLAWSFFGTKPPAPGETIIATTAPAVADMPTATTQPVKVVHIRDKAKAVEKLKIPAAQAPTSKEEIINAVTVPKLKNGGTATVFLNTTTGKSRTIITANPQPWFALERGNAVGVEYGIGSRGQYYRGDYRRDILQVKGTFLTGKAEVESYDQRIEGKAGLRLEYRW